MKINGKKIKVKFKMPIIITSLVIMIFMAISIAFSNQLEIAFKLKYNAPSTFENSLEVHFVDVGQGDAILVRLPNKKTMIVDSGPAKAKSDLLYYIDNVFFGKSEKVFDYVVLTHSDEDHVGNMKSVIEKYKVLNFFRPHIYASVAESEYIKQNSEVKVSNTNVYNSLIQTLNNNSDINIIFSESGITIDEEIQFNNNYSFEDSTINFLTPVKQNYSDTNQFSPIMMLQYGGVKFMLTGDATKANEREVLNNYDYKYLDVDVLKLGHHGSNTSSGLDFLNVVKPEYAIVSAGKNNKYGHPSKDVVENIYNYSNENNSELKNNTLNTAEVGNIIFYFDLQNNLSVEYLSNVNDYMFIEWYVVVVAGCVLVFVFMVSKGVSVNTGRASRV